jgi:putative restriction endonuclease
MARPELWTREQAIVVFNLYCRIPFGQMHASNKEVQKTAKIIGRTPNAVALKLGNFASFDPELKKRGVGGLPHTSKLDETIWNEFHADWNNLVYKSTELTAEFQNKDIEEIITTDSFDLPKGVDKIRSVKTRVYQDFFRKAVLAEYSGTCCITGIANSELLLASHIKPWSIDEENRTNPQNGLCLNALHDRAFDKGLLTILPNYKILISKHLESLPDKVRTDYFTVYQGREIKLPDKFVPEKKFLEYHNEIIFRK